LIPEVRWFHRDSTRQAKGLHRLKYVGALERGLAYLSRCNSGWFCHTCDPCDVLTPFCSIYIVWCTISYLLYLFVCMYLCVTIDSAQFEGPPKQGFEDVPE
jgi:hypothetical protein